MGDQSADVVSRTRVPLAVPPTLTASTAPGSTTTLARFGSTEVFGRLEGAGA